MVITLFSLGFGLFILSKILRGQERAANTHSTCETCQLPITMQDGVHWLHPDGRWWSPSNADLWAALAAHDPSYVNINPHPAMPAESRLLWETHYERIP